MATHSSILAWEIHGQRSLVGLWSMGSQKSRTRLSRWHSKQMVKEKARFKFFWNLSIKGKIKYRLLKSLLFLCIFQINVELCELFGTKQIVISHASQTINPAESTPSTIKTFLSKHCADYPNDWDDHLQAVSFAFNVTHLVCICL